MSSWGRIGRALVFHTRELVFKSRCDPNLYFKLPPSLTKKECALYLKIYSQQRPRIDIGRTISKMNAEDARVHIRKGTFPSKITSGFAPGMTTIYRSSIVIRNSRMRKWMFEGAAIIFFDKPAQKVYLRPYLERMMDSRSTWETLYKVTFWVSNCPD